MLIFEDERVSGYQLEGIKIMAKEEKKEMGHIKKKHEKMEHKKEEKKHEKRHSKRK